MPWRPITIDEVRLAPAEKAALQNIQASTDVGAAKLIDVVGEFRDAIAVAGTAVGADGTIPDLVRNHVINRTRWLWLCEFPQLKTMQTPERGKLNTAAEELLTAILAAKVKVPPGDDSAPDQSSAPNFGERPRDFTRDHQEGL